MSSFTEPFPGLRPYEQSDAPRFFGRHTHVAEMISLLEQKRFLAVVGASGSGKSSLVRAGLLTAIRDGYLSVDSNPDNEFWRIVIMRPGDDPYRALADAMCSSATNRKTPGEAVTCPIERVLGLLRSSQFGLHYTLRELGIPATEHLVLLVDQFEELFRFRRDEPTRRRAGIMDDAILSERRNDANAFVNMLLRSCEQAEQCIFVILTMRSDFLGDCDAFIGLPEAISQRQYLTPRLTRSQLEEAIRRPLALPEFQATIKDDLVTRILNDVSNEPDQLPLMQHALMRTWNLVTSPKRRRAANTSNGAGSIQLQVSDYEQVGGVTGALNQHADEIYESLRGESKRARLQRVAERLFCSLVESREIGPLVRRSIDVSEAALEIGYESASDDEEFRSQGGAREFKAINEVINDVKAVAAKFQAASFLVFSPENQSLDKHTRLDISHESLIRNWEKLKGWCKLEEEAAAQYRTLVFNAREHQRGRGELLYGLGLASALERWYDRRIPMTRGWSDRYCPGAYDMVRKFLQESDRYQMGLKEELVDRKQRVQKIPAPRVRRLRGYAIDPSLSTALLTSSVNQITYEVPWEDLESREGGIGESYPAGEYIEIVDYDPPSGLYYEPINLDDPHLLAQDGYAPSVNNPQFHQQFIYAVVMTTIKNFEKALGRKILWAENLDFKSRSDDGARSIVNFNFVKRLRVYPHALRQANAYYDPLRKALLFGYFTATPASPHLQLPGATVFTCLSHDIIAHETTHAILDGVHRRYIDATNPDMRAFHEAFADIVALFQHFSFPEVLKHQVAQTRGDLKRQNLLGQLAQQFGQAIGGYGSLRDAIGEYDENGNWKPRNPDPNAYATEMECHQRGAILVAAVFDAFLNIYENRVQKLIRIATGGTGRLPEGELHPDLVDEMAQTASSVANDVLRICIRALDYCPPMDLTFGDYLRGLVTADFDMISDDVYGYRVAFVEAFQKRGISAPGIKSMAVEDLLYPLYPSALPKKEEEEFVRSLRNLKELVGYLADREGVYEKTKELIRGGSGLHQSIEAQFIHGGFVEKFSEVSGLLFPGGKTAAEKLGLEYAYLTSKSASFAIGNISLANRVTPDGTIVNHIIMNLIQKRGVSFKVPTPQELADDLSTHVTVDEKGFFVPDHKSVEDWPEYSISFRGGCTLIFDLDTLRLRYAIKKDVDDRGRMIRQLQYEYGMGGDEQMYFDSKSMTALAGPFAFTHSHSAAR